MNTTALVKSRSYLTLLALLLLSTTLVTGQSLLFDGSTQHVTVPHQAALENIVEGDFTIEAWVNFNTTGTYKTIVAKGGGNDAFNTSYFFSISNNQKIAMYLSNGSSAIIRESNTTLSTNTWYHVAVAYDYNTRTLQFYLNGSPDGSQTNAFFSSSQTDTQPLYIARQGWDCGCNSFSGSLDEVRIWGSERTTAEIALSAQFPPSPASSGLIVYYDFNEGSGTTLNDNPGTDHGMLINSPTWNSTGYPTPSISPATSNWVEFDGASDYIEVPSYTDGGTGQATLEAWIRPEQDIGSNQTIINFYNQSHSLVLNGSALRFYRSGSNILSTDFTPYFGEETHVAVSITTGSQKMYINGIEVASNTTTFSGFSGPFRIGAGSLSEYNGKMTDIRIWNDVRSTAEIQANISSLLSGSEANLRAFYSMSEGSGTTLGDHSSNSFAGIFNEGDPGHSGFEQKSNFNGPKWTTDPAAVFPEFTSSSIHFTEENRTGLISDLSARIGSAGSPDVGITYSLSGTDASYFSVNSSDGQLSVTTELDFDDPSDANTDNQYEIVVSATAGSLVENKIFLVEVTNTDCTIDNEAPGGAGSGSGYFTIGTEQLLLQTFEPCATGPLLKMKLVANQLPTTGTLKIWEINSYAAGIPILDTQLGSSINLNTISWNVGGLSDFNTLTDIDLSAQNITLYAGNTYAFELDDSNGSFGRGPNTYAGGTIYHDFGAGVSDIGQDMVFLMDIIEAANTAPQFLSATAVDFDEETTGTVLDVDARDEYAASQGTPEDFNITYSLSGTDAALFDISSTSGVITFITPPDFEIPSDNGGDNVYDVTVTANDGLTAMQNIAITVQNTFESVTLTTSPTASIAENTTTVETLAVVGANSAGTLTYSITGGDDQSLFTLSGADLSFTAGPDFEVPGDNGGDNTYEVQVTADDTFTSDDLLISVTVTDEDEAPVAVLLSANTLAENGAVDDVIGTLSVENPDAGDTHTYLINGATSNSDFKISGDQLLANRVFDFETETSVDVDITAKDGADQELTQTISIDIIDTNDAPTDIQLSNSDIAENTTVGTAVATLTTTDVDPGDSHTYSLPTGYESNDSFEIVGNELRVLSAIFDFETDTDHIVRIETNDGNGGTYQEDFTLNVTDINEAPVFTTSASLNVSENTSSVVTLEATDEDAGSTLTFSISGGDDQSLFELTGSDLSFINARDFEVPTDQNADNIYDVQVSVSDGPFTVDQLFSVTVADLDEQEPPLMATEGSSYEFGIKPLAFLATPGDVTAITLPSWLTLDFPQVELQETLTGSEASSYQSVESTVIGEDGKSYLLFVGGITVLVVDPEGTDVTINLTGFDPFAVLPRRIVVDPVGNMYISDNDRIVKVELDETHTVVTSSLTYAKDLAWHPDGFLVVLDDTIIKKVETDGTITNLVTGLSTNTKAVSVSSQGDMFYAETGNFDPMNVEETVHQFQLDGTVGSNLFSPDFLDFEESTYDMIDIVADSQGRVYAHFEWTDALANIFDRIELIEVSGANSELVSHSIDVNSEKIISMTVGVDDELFYIDADLSSTITYIRSYSNSWLLSGTPGTSDVGDHNVALTIDNGIDPLDLSFTINVDYLNDAPTDLSLSPAVIDEGLAIGTVVGSLTATDTDIVHGDTHTYALVSGTGDTDNAAFTISGDEVLSNEVFDNEVQTQYAIRVEATDARGGVFSKALTIDIQDTNVAPTDISLSNDNIDEDAAVGSVIGVLSTTDSDAGDTHTYEVLTSFEEGGVTFFPIITDGTDLITTVPLDFESVPFFNIEIQVTDAGGLTYTELFTLATNDVNEAPTAMTLSANTIAENTAAGVRVGLLIGEDQDANHVLTYSLVAGTGDEGNDFFQMGGAGGNEIENAEILDFETQSTYSVRARVADEAGLSFEQVFTIEVTDNNDAPTGVELSSSTIAEHSEAGTTVGSFSAIDQDANDTHTFTFHPNYPDNSFFAIDGANLNVAADINFESTPTLTIGVFVNDASGGNTFEQEFIIEVTDVDEGQDQTITFEALDARTFGDSPFDLTATTTSDLTITYTSSDEGVATISGSTVTILSAGETTLTASQAGNAAFNPATAVSQTLVVAKATQTITFGSLADVEIEVAPITLAATTSSGLTVTFDVSGPATLSDNILTITGDGEVAVTASQEGDSNYLAAEPVTQSFLVIDPSKTDQTITFEALENRTFGDASFDLSGSASSGLALSYSSSDETVATISGSTVTIVGGGETIITASQDGDDTFNPAVPVSQTLTVEKLDQFLTFALEDKVTTDDPFDVTATSDSGLPVTISIASGPATISGSTITLTGVAGIVEVEFSQAGNNNYNATSVLAGFTVSDVEKQDQVITFDLPSVAYISDGSVALSASSDSGLDVEFEIVEGGAFATINNGALELIAPGIVTVAAAQFGNDEFNPAVVVAGIEIKPVFTLTGTITAQGSTFNGGTLVAIGGATDETYTLEVSGEGDYTLENLKDGDYYFGIDPTNTDDYYSTYYGDEIFWEDALVISVINQDLPGYNIEVQAKAADDLLTGNGVITGRIIEDDGSGGRVELGRILEGTAIPDVSVFLIRTSDDQIMTEVLSDSNGDFEITGIPEGDYRLKVEVAGAAMDLAGSTVSIDAEGTPVVLTAMVGEDGISLNVEPPVLGIEDGLHIQVYPNPAVKFIHSKMEGRSTVRVFDLKGQTLLQEAFEGNIRLNVSTLEAGVYFMEVYREENVVVEKFVKTN